MYREDATFVSSFQIFTDELSFQRDVADLVTEANFGSMEVTFNGTTAGFFGGFISAEHKANNEFSVSLKSYCLERVGLPTFTASP